MTTEYYALVGLDRTIDDPHFIWRDVRLPFYWGLDAYDPRTRRWIDTPWLACFTHNGEIGSEPISEEKAMELISQWSGKEPR